LIFLTPVPLPFSHEHTGSTLFCLLNLLPNSLPSISRDSFPFRNVPPPASLDSSLFYTHFRRAVLSSSRFPFYFNGTERDFLSVTSFLELFLPLSILTLSPYSFQRLHPFFPRLAGRCPERPGTTSPLSSSLPLPSPPESYFFLPCSPKVPLHESKEISPASPPFSYPPCFLLLLFLTGLSLLIWRS